jgi:hypothetical protein
LIAAADLLKQRGAYKVFVMATHGILSQDAPQLIEDSEIDEVNRLCILFFDSLISFRKRLQLTPSLALGHPFSPESEKRSGSENLPRRVKLSGYFFKFPVTQVFGTLPNWTLFSID